jgi:hypothetical protein
MFHSQCDIHRNTTNPANSMKIVATKHKFFRSLYLQQKFEIIAVSYVEILKPSKITSFVVCVVLKSSDS